MADPKGKLGNVSSVNGLGEQTSKFGGSLLGDVVAHLFPARVRLGLAELERLWPARGGEVVWRGHAGAWTQYRVVGLEAPNSLFVWPVVLDGEDSVEVLTNAIEMVTAWNTDRPETIRRRPGIPARPEAGR